MPDTSPPPEGNQSPGSGPASPVTPSNRRQGDTSAADHQHRRSSRNSRAGRNNQDLSSTNHNTQSHRQSPYPQQPRNGALSEGHRVGLSNRLARETPPIDDEDHDMRGERQDLNSNQEDDNDDHRSMSEDTMPERRVESLLVYPRPLSQLPAAGHNVEDKDPLPIDKRPDGIKSETLWQPLLPSYIQREAMPSVRTDNQAEKLLMNCLKYDMSPALNDEDTVDELIRTLLLTANGFRRAIPVIRLVPSGQTTTLFLHFANAAGSVEMEKSFSTFSISHGQGANEVVHHLKLKGVGRRVDTDVLSVTGKLVDCSSIPSVAVPHEVICRVAGTFAKLCRASPSALYPEAEHGILMLLRKQRATSYSDGAVHRSDFNNFEMAIRVSLSDQTNGSMLPYQTDKITGLKFCFTFPGSEKFCTVHADNTRHPDSYCSKKTCNICKVKSGIGGHWDWEHDDALHLRPRRNIAAPRISNASPSNNGSIKKGRGGYSISGRKSR